ncbi:MAG: hypothetical protein PF488_04440 [Patescibacteria group bacterium]|jgi:hypothetical protein|nr:hypothetical protein [Patescibacteria group bacterium]
MAYSNIYSFWLGFIRKTRASIKSVWRYRPNRWYFLLYLALFLFLTWQAYNIYSNLSGSLLVLRYRIDFGASLIGEPRKIFIYPIVSLLILLFNYIISLFFSTSSKNRFIFNLLFIGTNFITVFMILYLMSVYLVNFS